MQYLIAVGLFLVSLNGFSQGYTTPADRDGNGTPDYLQASVVPVITGQPTDVTICSEEATLFGATATGTDLSYQWQVSTDNESTYTDITVAGTAPVYADFNTDTLLLSNVPATADGYFYRLIIYETCFVCDSSITIGAELTVEPIPSAPTGSATQTFCLIDNPTVADLVATGSSIQWYLSATGGTALLSTDVLVDGTSYFASQTIASCESDTRFEVDVEVDDTNAPGGPANQIFCSIDNPTVADLSASGINNWYAAATGGSPLPLTTPLIDGNHYYATRIQGGCESSTRSDVTVTVTDVPAPTASDQTLCAASDSTVADIVATGTNISWFLAPTGGIALLGTDLVIDGTTYYAQDQIGPCRSPRTAVVVTLDTLIDLSCSLPASFTVNSDCQYVVPDLTAFTAITTCGPYTLTQSPAIGTILSPGYQYFEFLVTSGAVDSSCGRLIEIKDIELPVIATCADNDTVYADLNCGFPMADYRPELVFTDNCTSTGDMLVTQSPAPGTQIYVDQVVSFIVQDESGNTASCSFNLKVIDNGSPPSITCPADVNVSTDPGSCDATGVALGAPTPTGACAEMVITNNAPATYPLGDTDVTWTMTAEVIPNHVAPEAPDCLPTDVFLSPLNTTGGSLVMEKDVTVINSAGSTLVTDDLSFGSGTLCDGITCTQSGTTAATVAVSTDIGTGVDGALTTSATLTSDADFSAISLPAGGTLDLNGDLSIKVQTSFDAGIGATLNVNGDVVIQGTSFDVEENFTLNVISGSVTIICQARFQAHPYCVFNASDPNSIMILSEDWIRFHEQADVQGLFYAVDEIQLKANSLFTGMMTGNSLQVQQSCVVTGLYPNTCYVDPFSGLPGILNNDSEPTLPLNYAENVTSAVIDYDGIDSQDSEGAGLTWSISGPDAALFTLDTNSGILTFNTAPDFESPADLDGDNVYEVTITLTDTDSQIDSQDLKITITDVTPMIDTCVQTVTVNDNEAPILNCPSDISVSTDASNCDAVVNFTAPVGTDNCAGVTTVRTDATGLNSGDSFPIGVTTLSYQATDAAGNFAVCSFTVSVTDTEDPIAICQDIVVELDSAGAASIVPADIDNGSSDNCAFTLSIDINTFDCDDAGSDVIVTLTATDAAGNSSTCQSTVSIEDNIAPEMDCTDPIVTTTDPGVCTASVTYTLPAVTDNCSSSIVAQPSTGHFPGFDFPEGVTFVGYYANNPSNGISSTCTFPVTVTDDENPTISCPTDIVVDNDPGLCGSTVTYTEPVGNDNCTVASTTQTDGSGFTTGSFFPIGTTTLEYTVTDNEGNSTVCSFDVTVLDADDPVISTCPSDIDVDNDPGDCGAAVSFSTPTGSDLCGTVTVTQTDATGLSSGSIFPVGATTIIYEIEDEGGNTVVCSFDITVNDTEDPIAVCQPDTLDLGGGSVTLLPIQVFDALNSSDNCSVSPLSVTPNTFTAVGCYDVTLTVVDPSGNTDDCIVEICVTDADPPVANCIATSLDVYLDATGQVTVAGIDLDNGSTDNGLIVDYTASPALFDCDDIGVNPITLIVTDDGGNTDNCTATVNIIDTIAPVASCQSISIALDNMGQATITPAMIDNGSSDNCSIVDYSLDVTNFDCGDVGGNLVTLTVTDASGNSDQCQVSITIIDDEVPTITCPADITVPNDSGQPDAVVSVPGPLTDDNCAVASVINDYNSTADASDTYPLGTTTVNWLVTDINGNTAACSMTINVVDPDGPVMDCPDNVDVDASVNACETAVSIAVPTATDDSGIASIVNDFNGMDNASGVYPVGITTVTWTATDNDGNTVQCVQYVTVNDVSPPVDVQCPTDTILTASSGECGIDSVLVILTPPTASDSCGVVTITSDQPPYYNVGITTVTWIIEDESGNTSLCTQTVTVTDNEAPTTVTCPGDINIDNDPGECGAMITYDPPLAVDSCGIVSVTLVQGQLSNTLFPVGTTDVVYELEDVNGNITLCSFQVIVNDTEAPVLTAPDDITISAGPVECDYIVTFSTPQATDNCSGVTVTQTDATGLSSGDVFPVGITTLCFEAEDDSGNTATICFDINVLDVISPTLIDCPADVNVNADPGLCSADINLPEPVATDDCGSVTMTVDTIGPFDVGMTTVTWTIEDGSGNSAFCIYDVIVTDTQDPVIDCPSDISVLADYGFCEWDVMIDAPVTSDNCSIATVINDYNGTADASDSYPLGQTFVIWTVTDVNGNISTCTMIVNVDTPSEPVIDCPEDVIADTDPGSCSAALILDAPIAEVPCSIVSLVNDYNGGADASDTYPLGTTTVTWTVVDISGNIGYCSMDVTVVDNEAPIINCPEDINVPNDSSLCGALVFYPEIQVVDNCTLPTIVLVSGLASGEFFEVGTTQVVYEITDQSGNVTLCEFDVTVTDEEAPIIICPPDIITEDSLVFFDYPEFSDNCYAELILIGGPDSGDIFEHGSTDVLFAAVDLNGNMDTCSFTVLVNTPPVGVNDTIVLFESSETLEIDILDNDFDLDGDSIFIFTILPGNEYGTTDGLSLIYDVADFECGFDSLEYVVMDEFGASDTAIVFIDVECNPEVFVPEGFSPNGDGVNDVLEILGLELFPENRLQVFNRYGHIVLDRIAYENDWDGKSEAEYTVGQSNLPRGTYFYILELGVESAESLKGFFYINPE